MTSGTHYLNTDLDLNSEHDLGAIAKYLGDRGWSIHFAEQHPHGYWLGVFEHPNGHEVEPEKAIAAMLGVIDDFPQGLRLHWAECSKRDFNIGYQAGAEPHAFEQTISNDLLRRVAAAGASISTTIYAANKSAD